MATVKCPQCGEKFTPSKRGSPQLFCSTKCRMRAYRRRTADKRNDSEAGETIRLLRKDNNRLRRLYREALAKIPDPNVKTKRNVTDKDDSLEKEIKRLQRRVASLERPNYSMSVVISKFKGAYSARNIDGNEWDQGSSPMEALGALVFSHANTRTVTIEEVKFDG